MRSRSTVIVLSFTLAVFAAAGSTVLAQGDVPAQGAAPELAPDPAAGRLLVEAERLRQAGQGDAALAELKLLVERFPNSSQAPEAWLLLGQGRRRSGDTAGALQAAEELTRRYPASRQAAGGYLLQAEILSARTPDPSALEEARTVLSRIPLLFGRDRYPVLEARHQARVLSGRLSARLGDIPRAAAAFVRAIEDEPPSPWTSRARLGLAQALLQEGDWVAAADVLQRTLTASGQPGHPEADAAAAAEARRTLTLIHRLLIRPAGGQKPWQSARRLSLPGIQLKRPIGVAAAEDTTLIIVDKGLDVAIEVVPGGAVGLRRSVSDAGRPWFGLDGAYVGDDGIVRRHEDSWSGTFSAPRGGDREPLKAVSAGAVGAFGQWYLLDPRQDRVAVFRPSGSFIADLAGGDPEDLAVDGTGRVFVLDRKKKEVSRYSANGSLEAAVSRQDWRKPQALATDALGRIYVLDRDTGRIDVLSGDFAQITSVGPDLPGGIQLDGPEDLAVDGTGRILVADPKLQAVVVVE